MPAGMQALNAAGLVTFDLVISPARLIGTDVIGTAAGSISVPGFASGRPWIFSQDNGARYYWIDGNTIGWDWFPGGSIVAVRIWYGVY